MSSLSVLIRRIKRYIFYLIIFCLVRSYYLRKKRGGDDKRISGPPERKRITDGREQESEEKTKASTSLESKKENIEEIESSNEKVTVSLENTETAVDDDFKKEEDNIITESVDGDSSLSLTEEIKDPKFYKENNIVDIEKTEVVNDIIKENEIEGRTREVVVNNVEVIPETVISDQLLNKKTNQVNVLIEEEVIDDIAQQLNDTAIDTEENKSEELVNKVEEVIEEPEKLVEIVEEIIMPQEQNEIVENPEKIDVTIDESLEESNNAIIQEEGVIEKPVEEVIEVVEEIVEEIIESEPEEKAEEKIVEEIVEEVPSNTLEESTEQPQINEEATEEIVQLPTAEEPVVEEPIIEEPAVIEEPIAKEQSNETAVPEVIINSSTPLLTEEEKIEVTEESSRDMQKISEKEPQPIELLISEIEKVVNDSESDISYIKENEPEPEPEPEPIPEEQKPEKIIETKPVVNAADIVGHEEIIYEGDVDGDDDGEWVDDDGEWIDEDDDGEWVDEDEEEVEEVKPEINKRQSLLINTNLDTTQKRQSLIFNNTPIDTTKRQSLLLSNSMDILKNSLMAPLATGNNSLPVTQTTDDEKPKVLPDVILDRIFREVDPQTMWVLRNTSLKTRAIVDNILKETFEQFDLSMDPLYFDVTSKENLGLVLNSLDLSPFALAMLLHEILKLDSQHIGYAFGQMFRVPSKIDVDYLTDLIIETLTILKTKRGVDIAGVMLGLQQYYCFNHSELEFYELFEMIEMTPQEVARFIQNHYHFILSKSLPPLLKALDVDEVFVAEMCKSYANDDMDAFARIISKVPVQYVRTSIHPGDVQGDRVVVVNENGENVIVVLNNDEKGKHSHQNKSSNTEGDWVEEEEEEGDEEDDEDIEDVVNGESMIVVENNESFSLMVGRILRFLNMSTKEVASLFKYLPEYCSYDEDEILEGLNWNEEQIAEMRQIMKDEQDKIARKMKELSKLIIQRRMSIGGMNSPLSGSPIGRSPSASSSGARYL
ncbi:hypothetical protein PIROE2DRAFT_16195 [Piromyces sp. E2]|nr:hypothetical protein PIROE2DRAFT_16195 [Piromyces sp. E2]|eukprot:OUM58509.1 hypothetical protein PIROE2DRAFT_16195 [Piromyces sp. E2]